MPDGKKIALRKLLSPQLENFTLLNVGKTDKNGIILDSAEPVEMNARSEIKKQILAHI